MEAVVKAILTLLLIALASSLVGPVGAAQPGVSSFVAPSEPWIGVSRESPSKAPDGATTAEPSGAVAGPKYSASATWCAPTPKHCTDWGGNARLAAVNSFRWGDTPYWVRLTRGGAFADALVVSHCACHGQDGYIDVSPAVFRRLADLSIGRVDVEVELLDWPYEPDGDPPPHPDDEEMRLEDRKLPATDAVP